MKVVFPNALLMLYIALGMLALISCICSHRSKMVSLPRLTWKLLGVPLVRSTFEMRIYLKRLVSCQAAVLTAAKSLPTGCEYLLSMVSRFVTSFLKLEICYIRGQQTLSAISSKFQRMLMLILTVPSADRHSFCVCSSFPFHKVIRFCP